MDFFDKLSLPAHDALYEATFSIVERYAPADST